MSYENKILQMKKMRKKKPESEQNAEKVFKKISQVNGKYRKEDIIFRLMGNRNYL